MEVEVSRVQGGQTSGNMGTWVSMRSLKKTESLKFGRDPRPLKDQADVQGAGRGKGW